MTTASPTTAGRTIPDNINAIALTKCKAASVFLDVESRPGRRATGSGWVGLEKNLIFTNAHVVGMKSPGSKKPVKMTAYLHSGTPQQKEIPHSRLEILAVDREADLAVIRVLNEPGMPPPLETRPSAELSELEKAVILGFPGGYTLAEITKSRVCWTRKIDELIDVVNQGGEGQRHFVWLDDLIVDQKNDSRQNSFGSVRASGHSGSDNFAQVANFLEDLETSPFVRDFFPPAPPEGTQTVVDTELIPSEVWAFPLALNLKGPEERQ